MAKIQLEPGDICEVEDNHQSGWNPISVDELTVTIMSEANNGFWNVRATFASSKRRGIIHESYLHPL